MISVNCSKNSWNYTWAAKGKKSFEFSVTVQSSDWLEERGTKGIIRFYFAAAIIAGCDAVCKCHARCVEKKENRRNDFKGRQRAHRSSSYLTSHYYARPPHPLQLVIPFVRLNDELIPDVGRHA